MNQFFRALTSKYLEINILTILSGCALAWYNDLFKSYLPLCLYFGLSRNFHYCKKITNNSQTFGTEPGMESPCFLWARDQ